ncbi:MAG: hypothetical protein ACP5I4_00315 [Oceanipulchritudo sp.]
MADSIGNGNWLLIDAAGPLSVFGLVGKDGWRDCMTRKGDLIENLQPVLEELLARNGTELADLDGCLYATGPGSTLGLRLSAMFLRTLMALPPLEHWKCLQYHNLSLALAGGCRAQAGVAPWRRDRVHLTSIEPGPPLSFTQGNLSPKEAAERALPGFLLGRRPATAGPGIDWQPYPHEHIPERLLQFPELLQKAPGPTPYTAEDPEFARWTPRRHAAK